MTGDRFIAMRGENGRWEWMLTGEHYPAYVARSVRSFGSLAELRRSLQSTLRAFRGADAHFRVEVRQ